MLKVQVTKKVLKQLMQMDAAIQHHFDIFFQTDLMANPFAGKLEDGLYHAHVKYHYVAVWKVDKTASTVTVIYAGTRENAPY
jgi:mRNA-degrading endonuclease RelE of RelBE toxin-antitoxin system